MPPYVCYTSLSVFLTSFYTERLRLTEYLGPIFKMVKVKIVWHITDILPNEKDVRRQRVPRWDRGCQDEIRVFGNLMRFSLCPYISFTFCIRLLTQLAPISSSCSILIPLLQSRPQLCFPDGHGGFLLSFTSDSSLFQCILQRCCFAFQV